jgi:hypothetical protein
MGVEDLLRLHGGEWIGHPMQHVIEAAAGEGGGVQVGLDDLGRLRGVEAGGVAAVV